ncbi:MAG: hypothetical protein ABIG55_04820, partial [Candidatus Omnitrophota bacterium]
MSGYTLAPPTRFASCIKAVNGIRTQIEFSTDSITKEAFKERVLNDPEYKRILYQFITYLNRDHNAYEMFFEMTANAYDAIIDKVKSTGKDFVGKIVMETYFDEDSVIINMIDNGKTAEFDEYGFIKKRPRDPERHFRKNHSAVYVLRTWFAGPGYSVSWQPLKDGTRLTLKMPKRDEQVERSVKTDEYIIIRDDDRQRYLDEETVRSVRAGEALGRAFRNRVAFRDISTLIGLYLRWGISEHTLIPDIKQHIDAAELAISKTHYDPLLAGFEIDEMFYDEDENAYYLPVYRDGVKRYLYKYYLEPGTDPASMTIPLGDGTDVYVKV